MVLYPVIVTVKPYGGENPKKLAAHRKKSAAARQIQEHLNEQMKPLEPGAFQTFLYYEISRDLGLDKEIVGDLLYAVDCGSNGITIGKPNRAQEGISGGKEVSW